MIIMWLNRLFSSPHRTCQIWQVHTSPWFSLCPIRFGSEPPSGSRSLHFKPMKSLPNYLQSQRKHLSLSQEEVGFLLGIGGMGKGEKVCREENFLREPSLQDALAYESIYGRPVSELFAGLYQQAEQAVAARAKILNFRKLRKSDVRKQETIVQLAAKASVNSAMQ